MGDMASGIRSWLVFFAIGAGLASVLTAQEVQVRPNVLFISIDDLRPELGCYGQSQILSPNIDRLAAEGMLFSRTYCQAPVCGASRASLLTGLRPTATRFKTFKTYAQTDAPGAVSLPESFKMAGYYTISNGKIFHKQDDMEAQSWSEPAWRPDILGRKFLDPKSKKLTKMLSAGRKRGPFFEAADVPDNAYYDGQVAEKTLADLARLKKMDKPFFLACGFVRPHLPLYAPKKYWDLYEHDKISAAKNCYAPNDAPLSLSGSGEIHDFGHRGLTFYSTEFHRSARHAYYACVSYVDAQVGMILQALDDLELRENTIVVL
jgi:iduronate 2-sulfatase